MSPVVSLCDSVQTYSVIVPAEAVWQPDQLHFDDARACLALQLQLMASTSKGEQRGLWPWWSTSPCPVKIFAQCVCLELFHPVIPSVSSMWFPLSSTYMLYFLVFFFYEDFTIWENYCESAIIFCGPQTPPVPFNRSLPVHELSYICQNNIWCLKIVVNGFQVAGKRPTLFLFLMHLYSYTSNAKTQESLYMKRGTSPMCLLIHVPANQ